MSEHNASSAEHFDIRRKNDQLLAKVKSAAERLSKYGRKHCANEIALVDFKRADRLSPECAELRLLIDEVDQFLRELGKASGNSESIDDYLWVCDTAIKWEHRLSDLFNFTRTVSLKKAPSNLLPPLAPGDALSESELKKRTESLSRVVYIYRARSSRRHVYNETLAIEDWHKAEVFLANDILDGTIDFSRRISSSSYWRLEKIWMAEVRELLAYLDWESDGAVLFDSNTELHYQKAWEDFNKRIRSTKSKATRSEFGEAKRYLEERYVTQEEGVYKLDYKKIHDRDDETIIERKSRKVQIEAAKWNKDRAWDNNKNWYDAEYYIKLFYENIISAVVDSDRESAAKVLQAFDYSMRGPHRIINAFEMALAIYFVRNDILPIDEFSGIS